MLNMHHIRRETLGERRGGMHAQLSDLCSPRQLNCCLVGRRVVEEVLCIVGHMTLKNCCHGDHMTRVLTLMRALMLAVVFRAMVLSLFCTIRNEKYGFEFTCTTAGLIPRPRVQQLISFTDYLWSQSQTI